MDFSPLMPTAYQANIFSSITLENDQAYVPTKKVELLDIYVTEFPRLSAEDLPATQFAFTYFEHDKVDFLKYQDSIQSISKELLGHTQPLTEFEQSVLNQSFKKALKSSPSRPNRR